MKRVVVTYCLVSAVLLSCRKENIADCVTSNGPEVVQQRMPGEFNNLVVYDKFDVTIRRGAEYKLEIKAGRNMLKHIVTRNEGGILYIQNRSTCNFVRGYKRVLEVVVTCPYLRRAENSSVGTMRFEEGYEQDTIVLRAESSGDIHLNGNFNQVRTSSHGNGDVYLNGTSSSLFVYTYGTNFVHAENFLVSDFAFVDTYSIGDCYINGTRLRSLEFNIWKSGNIYYTGNPAQVREYTDGSAPGEAIPY
jgi:hypothetical protein